MTWEFEHSIVIGARKKTVWDIYSNIESWPLWDHEIEDISLNGEFREGVQGKIKMGGQDILNYKITFSDPNKGFSEEAVIDELKATVKFVHTFSDLPEGKTGIIHHITVLCPGKEEMEENIGNSISSGVPKAMESLARMAIFLEKVCGFH